MTVPANPPGPVAATWSNIENTAIVARMAGFTGSALVTIVALAGCESRWNPTALNDNPATGDYSVGLFQINYFQSLGPQRTQLYGSPQQLLADPLAQARAAYGVSNGGADFSPWSTYHASAGNRPCYLSNIPAATAAVAATEGATNPTWQVGSDTTLASANTSGGSGSGSGSDDNACLLSLPSLGPIGGGCLLHQSNVRALAGAGILVGGVVISLVGIALLVGGNTGSKVLGAAGPVGKAVYSRIPSREDRLARRAERNPGPTSMPKPRRYNAAGELVNSRGETFL